MIKVHSQPAAANKRRHYMTAKNLFQPLLFIYIYNLHYRVYTPGENKPIKNTRLIRFDIMKYSTYLYEKNRRK